jgi:hypothetical protein
VRTFNAGLNEAVGVAFGLETKKATLRLPFFKFYEVKLEV